MISAGDATFFACTGFVTECNAFSATILTSASLVRVSGDVQKINTNLRVVTDYHYLLLVCFPLKIILTLTSSLQIEVCLRNGFRVIGILKHYNLCFNVACIEIMGYWNLLAMRVSPDAHFINIRGDVIAVGCLFDGFKIMTTMGVLLGHSPSKFDCQDLRVSTSKITKVRLPIFFLNMRNKTVSNCICMLLSCFLM